jgi:diacylglycerol kinase family enzyme
VDEKGEPCELSHEPPVTINVDGEPCLQTPATFEFYPKQLWIRGAQEVSWDKV